MDTHCDIELVRCVQENRFVSCSTYDSLEMDSADVIHNAQPCKYSQRTNSTDSGNDEETPDPPLSPICKVNESNGDEAISHPEQNAAENLQPTPMPLEDMSQCQFDHAQVMSTPKESVSGAYSLVANQLTLSTL